MLPIAQHSDAAPQKSRKSQVWRRIKNPDFSSLRFGFTLIEALIAITMTLVIMLALAQGFKRLSDDISKGRARLSLSDQLRGVSEILRNDLAGLTVDTDPTSKATKSGYFLYYEGPIADHHPVTCPINSLPGGSREQQLSASKYGDFDDILMFTARAKGEWFRGRVPLAIVKGAAAGVPIGTNYPGYDDTDWLRTVVVASEYAEIAYFMMPNVLPTPDPATPYEEYRTDPTDPTNLNLPIVDRDTPVNPTPANPMPGYFAGTTGNAVPDGFKLCRRVLLILPNLNLPAGQLFSGGTLAASTRLLANPVTTANGSRRMLENAYQRCDLSVHRVPSALANAPIAANSLEDLANPLNRFAHVTLPGATIGAPPESRTMPILSLTGPLPLQQYALDPNISLAARAGGALSECGFMRPEFLKRTFDPATGIVQLTENPETGNDVEVLSNEEVLSTNCIAFDLKGYDPIARLLYHTGSDGIAGNGTGWATLGATGSDDLVLSPSDPGYYDSIASLTGGTPPTLDQLTASQGTFVDLGWGMKTRINLPSPTIVPATAPAIFRSSLSGVEGVAPAFSLRKSGRVVGAGTGPFTAVLYQPCFDSYTEFFEHDGFRQRPTPSGTIFTDGNAYITASSVGLDPATTDIATNGLDDNIPGVIASNGLIDDYLEQDSSPPILSAMPAIQALIRLEDSGAGVIQQIAVTHDLVN